MRYALCEVNGVGEVNGVESLFLTLPQQTSGLGVRSWEVRLGSNLYS